MPRRIIIGAPRSPRSDATKKRWRVAARRLPSSRITSRRTTMPARRYARSAATMRRSRASTARWRCSRDISRPTTIAATCWKRSTVSTRRSPATTARWRSRRTSPRHATIAAACYSASTAPTTRSKISRSRFGSIQAMPRHGHAEARFAACIAELPVVYTDESEIPRRRAAYEQKLRALSKDVDSGLLQGNLIKAMGAKQPFLLAYQGGNDRELQQVYGEMIARIVARHFPPAPLPPPPAPGEPIRVGIVSGFFFRHSNWKIPIKGWISQLDRSRFRVTGYYLGIIHDEQTDVAAGICDRFVHRILDTEGWRREILADAPHVLIYPGLLMDTSSLQLAAQRLAPVQCNSWGHPETSGLSTLDYFLSSDLMEAPDAEAYYTEKLVRLPNLSIFYKPVAVEPVSVTREELGLRPRATVFWSAQSLYKYLPQYDDVFVRIALAAVDCQFVFLRHFGGSHITQVVRTRLERAFAAAGLRADNYCVFLDRLSQSKFVAVAGISDIFLEASAGVAGHSLLESLPPNLPIVTMPSAMMRGRHCAAILQMMGVTETIADTIDDYVAIAVRLANNPAERQALRERMKASAHKVYRDRACITALEDFLERAARSPGAYARSGTHSAS